MTFMKIQVDEKIIFDFPPWKLEETSVFSPSHSDPNLHPGRAFLSLWLVFLVEGKVRFTRFTWDSQAAQPYEIKMFDDPFFFEKKDQYYQSLPDK